MELDELKEAMQMGYDDAISDYGAPHYMRKNRDILNWHTTKAVAYTLGYDCGQGDAETTYLAGELEAKE